MEYSSGLFMFIFYIEFHSISKYLKYINLLHCGLTFRLFSTGSWMKALLWIFLLMNVSEYN